MTDRKEVTGKWSGRLIDVLGSEGALTLDLAGKSGRYEGRFTAVIAGSHRPLNVEGRVSGNLKRDQLTLQLSSDTQDSVKVELRGQLTGLQAGGAAVCGSYDVSQRAFSPVAGGIVVLTQDDALNLKRPEISVSMSRPVS